MRKIGKVDKNDLKKVNEDNVHQEFNRLMKVVKPLAVKRES